MKFWTVALVSSVFAVPEEEQPIISAMPVTDSSVTTATLALLDEEFTTESIQSTLDAEEALTETTLEEIMTESTAEEDESSSTDIVMSLLDDLSTGVADLSSMAADVLTEGSAVFIAPATIPITEPRTAPRRVFSA